MTTDDLSVGKGSKGVVGEKRGVLEMTDDCSVKEEEFATLMTIDNCSVEIKDLKLHLDGNEVSSEGPHELSGEEGRTS